jgi:uncharacterized protein involved in exopolysaccharide biosynthesis
MYKEFNLLDFLVLIFEKKKIVIKWVLALTFLSVVVAFFIPKKFKSTTQFFISTSSAPSLGGVLGSLIPTSFSSAKVSGEQALVFLNGRTIKEKIIEEFKIDSVNGFDYIEQSLRFVEGNTKLVETREGGFGFNPIISIELSYIDESPETAYNIVNRYLVHLDSLITATNKRSLLISFEIIKKQFEENQNSLKSAESALNEFQKQNGIIQIDEQAKARIESFALLKQKSLELELQKNIFEMQGLSKSTALNQINTQLMSLKTELDKVLQGTQSGQISFEHSLNQYPDLLKNYGELYREVIVQNKIYEFIYPIYRQQIAQIDGINSGIQFIDKPSFPTYKDSPKRLLIILGGVIASLIFSVIHIVFQTFLNDASPETREKLMKLRLIKP